MLTYEECLAMCDLTEGEIKAIAEHEHMDPMIALALGQYLISHEGDQRIKSIIIDDIRHAERSRNLRHAEVLRKVLQHFLATHPDRDKVAAA